jgi:uncharacterized protein YndB with AHSA1/START domain
MRLRGWIAPLSGVALGLLYGLGCRLIFDSKPGGGRGYGNVFAGVSLAFLFLVPFALGALTAALAPRDTKQPWLYWLLMPWVSTALLLLSTFALAWEGIICLVMASPIMFLMAMLGGLVVGFVITRRQRPMPPAAIASCIVLPFVWAPLEAQLPRPDGLRTVTTVVDIAAPPEAVWRQVVRVPLITEDEQTSGFFQAIGIPKPLEATLSHDGVGGLREARFAGGIRFHENVTEWEPNARLGFTIEVDPDTITAAVLDDHVRVGGEYFDVVFGRFDLKRTATGTRLTLESRHQLRTTFNAYAGLWTDAVMSDIQGNICRVIRSRSEQRGPR